MRYLAILLLTGCQLTVARLPEPVNPDVAQKLVQQEQKLIQQEEVLKVLAEDYNKRQKK